MLWVNEFVDPTDALTEARQLGASTKPAWRTHLDPNGANVPLREATGWRFSAAVYWFNEQMGELDVVLTAACFWDNVVVEAEGSATGVVVA